MTKLVRPSRVVMSTDSIEPVTARKKKIRGGHKVHLRKLISSVNHMLRHTDSAENNAELLSRKLQLERKAQIISKLDKEILGKIEDEVKIAHEIETAEEIHSEIAILRIKIERVLQQTSEKEKQEETTRATEMNNPVSKTISMKLPKLEVKRFSRDPKEYKSFKNSFEKAVNRSSDKAEVEKFTYLKSFLTGETSRAVKGLAVTTENYEEALKVLDKRYGNVQVIVNSHFEELTKLPVVHNNNDTAKLRELYDKIETNLRSLRAIGIQADTYGCVLVPNNEK